mmetsp:Transcript_28865/g.52759  ORF Transcript_28865/g.52759 Transcript_28865/m.52759 type:complete len:107 (+) Transcript_28865:229-549(+)
MWTLYPSNSSSISIISKSLLKNLYGGFQLPKRIRPNDHRLDSFPQSSLQLHHNAIVTTIHDSSTTPASPPWCHNSIDKAIRRHLHRFLDRQTAEVSTYILTENITL